MQRIIRGGFVACLLLGLAGCEPAPTPAAGDAATPASPATNPPPQAPAPPPPSAPVPPPAAATAVLQVLTLGDRACYVTLADAQGLTREEMGRMELCELEALIGRPVLPVYGEEAVAAEACQGDPECTQTETLRLLIELKPVR
jgi:hypothetical protein